MTDDLVNLSALNQFAYCPRHDGLIYQEGDARREGRARIEAA